MSETSPAAAPPAPIVVMHGVGRFEPGELVAEMAEHPVFARVVDLKRETVFARSYAYTQLMQRRAGAERTRLLEVNWSDVRRAMPNIIGLLRNFVSLLMALNRIGVFGAWRSATLSQPLVIGRLTLWMVEAVLVWASLAPALSALLWLLAPGERFACGVLVAGASAYTGYLVRRLSLPLAAGGAGFAVFAAAAGWWTCYGAEGHLDFTSFASQVHTWATLLASTSVLIAAAEVLLRPLPHGMPARDAAFLHRLARLGCLWLPIVFLVLLQPLSVSLMLLPMSHAQRTNWGIAFARDMPFDPHDAQLATSWVALALGATLLLGALQFKLVQRFGRDRTALSGWAVGLGMLVVARMLELRAFRGCVLCQQCLRTDWLAISGAILVASSSVSWALFRHAEAPVDGAGRAWHPAGAFARRWAHVVLAGMPIVLTGTLLWLWTRVAAHADEEVLADASEVFLQSTKYALLLLPVATKPFAALLDALGDIFYFLVRHRELATRMDTLPRLWRALGHIDPDVDGHHVVVFAHSQGTVIAAALFGRMATLLRRSPMRITLVTVGSPLSTLFRGFLGATFGATFAALCREPEARFRWFNLVRPADYIGGAVQLPGVANYELLTPGDHVGYWTDRELLGALKALSEGAGAAEAFADPLRFRPLPGVPAP